MNYQSQPIWTYHHVFWNFRPTMGQMPPMYTGWWQIWFWAAPRAGVLVEKILRSKSTKEPQSAKSNQQTE